METRTNLEKSYTILKYLVKDDPGLASQVLSNVAKNDPDNVKFLLNLGYLPSGTDDATAIFITSYFESDGEDPVLEQILAKGVSIDVEVEIYEEMMVEHGDIFKKYGYSVKKISERQPARKTSLDGHFGSPPVFAIKKNSAPSTVFGRKIARHRNAVELMEY